MALGKPPDVTSRTHPTFLTYFSLRETGLLTKAIEQKMIELRGQEYGWYLTRKLVNSSFSQARLAEQGPAKEFAKRFMRGAQVESGMVSHIA